MAAAYADGVLPAAAAAVEAGADERARMAAELIAQWDDHATSALLAAVLDAGFGVRDHAGQVQRRGAASQGLLLEGWELAAAAKMYGEGRRVSLAEFGEALGALPGLAGAPLDRLLLEALRAHASSGNAPVRAWARLIVELGRASPEPYDLLAESDPARIQLDPIQTLLILRRLFGDLYAAGGAGGDASVPAARPWPRASGAASASGARLAPALRAQRASSACNTGSDGSFVLDVAALGLTTGFGQVLDYVEQALGEKAGAVTGYQRVSGIASLVLAYGKLLATYAALETEITTEPAGVLERTKNREPGARKDLVARLTMKTGKWEQINCLRTALNVATGLDVSLVSDGPVEGATVRWHLDEGGGMAWASAQQRGREAEDAIVQLTGTGPRIQDAGTKAGVGGSGVAVGDLGVWAAVAPPPALSRMNDNQEIEARIRGSDGLQPSRGAPHLGYRPQRAVEELDAVEHHVVLAVPVERILERFLDVVEAHQQGRVERRDRQRDADPVALRREREVRSEQDRQHVQEQLGIRTQRRRRPIVPDVAQPLEVDHHLRQAAVHARRVRGDVFRVRLTAS